MKDAAREVEKTFTNGITLAKDVTKPVISQLNTSMIPLCTNYRSKGRKMASQKLTRKQIEKEVIPQLESMDGVANVMFYGKSTSEFCILYNPVNNER